MVEQAGHAAHFRCASAGTHAYHVGEPPDLRAQQAAFRRGYDLSAQRARKVLSDDFTEFDLMLAMDTDNMAALMRMRPSDARIVPQLFLDYIDGAGRSPREVADPYYGGRQDFDNMLDVLEQSAAKLLFLLVSRNA